MKQIILIGACLFAVACSRNPSSPTPQPTPIPVPVPVTPPPVPVVGVIESMPCPTSLPGFSLDVTFYRQIGCNAFESAAQPARRWTRAPLVYLRTVDDAGKAVDQTTLDTVASALINSASALTGGRFGLAGMERGTESRIRVSGWLTVQWVSTPSTAHVCAITDIATDGGTLNFNYKTPNCGCNGSAEAPRVAKHELGHALGYFHTDSASDLMSNLGGTIPCDQPLSGREQQAAAYHYR